MTTATTPDETTDSATTSASAAAYARGVFASPARPGSVQAPPAPAGLASAPAYAVLAARLRAEATRPAPTPKHHEYWRGFNAALVWLAEWAEAGEGDWDTTAPPGVNITTPAAGDGCQHCAATALAAGQDRTCDRCGTVWLGSWVLARRPGSAPTPEISGGA